jgi:hypothetical protein
MFVFAVIIVSLHVSECLAKEVVARGLGTYSCGQYAQMYRTNPKQTDFAFGSWAQGFMSGWNWSLMDKKIFHDMGAETADEMDFALRQYCDAHPLASFVQAVIQHFEKLPAKSMPQSN